MSMIVTILSFVIGIAASLLIYFFTPMAESWWNLFWLIPMIPFASALAFGLFLVVILFVGFFVRKDKEREKPSKLALWVLTKGATTLAFYALVRIKKSGFEKLPKDGKFLMVSNHLSNFDQICMLAAFQKVDTVYISKHGNFHIPAAGGLIALSGYIPLSRDDAFQGAKAIRKAANYLKDDKYYIGICPEGTRSKDHEFHEFHAGSFKIATWGQKPIVVVGLQNTWAVAKRYPFRFTTVHVDVIDVIPYEDFKDLNTQQISDLVHKKIEVYLEENRLRDYRFKKEKKAKK